MSKDPTQATHWRRFKAWMRWDLEAVCDLSRGRGRSNDYHDYPDSTLVYPINGKGYPAHFFVHHCKRCGKAFTI